MAYVIQQQGAVDFLKASFGILCQLRSRSQKTKQSVVMAVRCKSGHHRSVAMVELLQDLGQRLLGVTCHKLHVTDFGQDDSRKREKFQDWLESLPHALPEKLQRQSPLLKLSDWVRSDFNETLESLYFQLWGWAKESLQSQLSQLRPCSPSRPPRRRLRSPATSPRRRDRTPVVLHRYRPEGRQREFECVSDSSSEDACIAEPEPLDVPDLQPASRESKYKAKPKPACIKAVIGSARKIHLLAARDSGSRSPSSGRGRSRHAEPRQRSHSLAAELTRKTEDTAAEAHKRAATEALRWRLAEPDWMLMKDRRHAWDEHQTQLQIQAQEQGLLFVKVDRYGRTGAERRNQCNQNLRRKAREAQCTQGKWRKAAAT